MKDFQNNKMIKAVIFDMDGLLIDSEPLWREAIIKVFDNIGLKLTFKQCQETMGLRVNEVVEYWFTKNKIKGVQKEKVIADIAKEVANFIKLKGKIMKGAQQVIGMLSSRGIPLAIASSSPMSVIDAVLEKISIKDKMQVVNSAEHESHGKPHPDVYISTAKKLNISPDQCLAFEDSPNGVLSAKAAKMKCVAVPDSSLSGDKIFSIADLTIGSLEDFTLKRLENLNTR